MVQIHPPQLPSQEGIFLESEWIIIIPITKQERDYLVKNGVRYGENGISKTKGHYKNYYLCTSRNNMILLNQYSRKNIVTK